MSGAWTPGPWTNHQSHIYAPDGAIIAQVHNPGSKASDYPLVANRDLMTAAPDLYAALERLVDAVSGLSGGVAHISADARAALAKARGEAK